MKPGDIRMEKTLEGDGVYLLRPGVKARTMGADVAIWHVLVLTDETWVPGAQLELSLEWLNNATEKFKP